MPPIWVSPSVAPHPRPDASLSNLIWGLPLSIFMSDESILLIHHCNSDFADPEIDIVLSKWLHAICFQCLCVFVFCFCFFSPFYFFFFFELPLVYKGPYYTAGIAATRLPMTAATNLILGNTVHNSFWHSDLILDILCSFVLHFTYSIKWQRSNIERWLHTISILHFF